MPAAEASINPKPLVDTLPLWGYWWRSTPRHHLWVQYQRAGQMPQLLGRGGKVELWTKIKEWRKSVNRVSDLGTGGKLSFGHVLPWFVFSLPISILYSISAWYRSHWHWFLPPPDCCQVQEQFPCLLDWLTGHHTLPTGDGTNGIIQLHTFDNCPIGPIDSILLNRLLQPSISVLKEEDNVMVEHALEPGNGCAV